MDKPEVEALRAAVEHLHGCPAFFVAEEVVIVSLRGETVLQRNVATFVLDKILSPMVYAWTESGATSPFTTTHHRVVLRDGQVRSARDAIRYALLLPHPDVEHRASEELERRPRARAEDAESRP